MNECLFIHKNNVRRVHCTLYNYCVKKIYKIKKYTKYKSVENNKINIYESITIN